MTALRLGGDLVRRSHRAHRLLPRRVRGSPSLARRAGVLRAGRGDEPPARTLLVEPARDRDRSAPRGSAWPRSPPGWASRLPSAVADDGARSRRGLGRRIRGGLGAWARAGGRARRAARRARHAPARSRRISRTTRARGRRSPCSRSAVAGFLGQAAGIAARSRRRDFWCFAGEQAAGPPSHRSLRRSRRAGRRVSHRTRVGCSWVSRCSATQLEPRPSLSPTRWCGPGSLVFGGGHVVLPLLEEAVVAPGWVSGQEFLAGYGLAQAMPGPLFSFSAYLGAIQEPTPTASREPRSRWSRSTCPRSCSSAAFCRVRLSIRRNASVQAALVGVGAAVVGILAAAFWDPILTASVDTRRRRVRRWLLVLLAPAGLGVVPRPRRPGRSSLAA